MSRLGILFVIDKAKGSAWEAQIAFNELVDTLAFDYPKVSERLFCGDLGIGDLPTTVDELKALEYELQQDAIADMAPDGGDGGE